MRALPRAEMLARPPAKENAILVYGRPREPPPELLELDELELLELEADAPPPLDECDELLPDELEPEEWDPDEYEPEEPPELWPPGE